MLPGAPPASRRPGQRAVSFGQWGGAGGRHRWGAPTLAAANSKSRSFPKWAALVFGETWAKTCGLPRLVNSETHPIWSWYGCGSKPFWYYSGVGEFITHFRTYFSGDWDVHWGDDLDFDPWPY